MREESIADEIYPQIFRFRRDLFLWAQGKLCRNLSLRILSIYFSGSQFGSNFSRREYDFELKTYSDAFMILKILCINFNDRS